MTDRETLHRLLDEIPEHKLHAVATLLETLKVAPEPTQAPGQPEQSGDGLLKPQEVAADKMDKDLGI